MDNSIALPTYADEELASLSPARLVDILLENTNCVPRNVIDVCARLGDDMTAYLLMLHEEEFFWKDDEDDSGEISDGRWWLQHHAVMILGQISSEQAGLLLVEIMRRFSQEDSDMQDWIAGYWPALFLNKPATVLPALRTLAEDRELDDYIRANALEVVIADAARQGGDILEQALAWLAGMAKDESDEWEFCLMAASLLLLFPREQYRPLLDDLAKQQGGFLAHFSIQDVQQVYDGNALQPDWEHYTDPWAFYEPDAITARQTRGREEAERRAKYSPNEDIDDDLPVPYDSYYTHETYVRPEPKVGRNDPCPCGSGKKYKKCCLAKE